MSQIAIRRFEDETTCESPVRGYMHVPAGATGDGLVLTHEAGSNCESPLLKAVAVEFCEAGMHVLRCDLPFRQLRPHGPPVRGSAERDQQGLRRALNVVRQSASGRIFLGGHSYGGRQGSMLAARDAEVATALLLLSYPLHPPKRPTELRTAHFGDLRTPAFFVHGTRAGFGSIEEISRAIELIPAQTKLLPIEGAGHELLTARNRSELPKLIAQGFRAFLHAGKRML